MFFFLFLIFVCEVFIVEKKLYTSSNTFEKQQQHQSNAKRSVVDRITKVKAIHLKQSQILSRELLIYQIELPIRHNQKILTYL